MDTDLRPPAMTEMRLILCREYAAQTNAAGARRGHRNSGRHTNDPVLTGVGARAALLGGVVPIDRPPNGPRFGAVLLRREDADEPERDFGVSPVTAASSLARREIN
jgi:hypothetical protein